ncbi:hypothetical protein like AT4G18220 [Hibiscus trionum]|uniref:Probable purine permease n=1 Tax=Hibiscus trionum TaxID=183268 RepID=A0A9W7HRV4_HIBTR|nr:hypothetical protein like AT4G18220 [Hibiscus trionum]
MVISETSDKDFRPPRRSNIIRWLRIALYVIVGFLSSTAASLLTRLYYEKGGTSKWVGALIQVVGFPVLLPYYFISRLKVIKPSGTTTSTATVETTPPSLLSLVCVYTYLGLLIAGNAFLFSVGFEYLPLSTLSLISASQLAFNAFFSYFLNSQKLTPFIINSLFLLTLSSITLVANSNSEKPPAVSDGKYLLGIICTLTATAMSGLSLASQQMVFRKVLKRQSVKVVMDVAIYQSLVASIVMSIGFLASGEWKGLKSEMEGYALGKSAYVNTLVWTAVSWQVSIFCGVALVFELSALLANVIGAVGMPIAPVTALIVFHDKMNGLKGISMALALWGFLSYVYQQYLDERKLSAETKQQSVVSLSKSEA